MRSSLTLVCIRSAALALPLVIACGTANNTGGGFGSGSSGNSGDNGGNGNAGNGNGGSSGSGGTGSNSGSSGNSGSANGGSSGANSGNSGAGTTGAGGTAGTNSGNSGAGTTGGNSGATTGASGSTTGAASGMTGASGASGSTTGTTGTSGMTGSSGGTASACGTPGPNVLSDFESDTGSLVKQGGRTGWWYVFADTVAGTQTPTAVATGPIAVGAAPADAKTLAGETCNKYSLISTATGHTMYAGVGATFIPGAGTTKTAFDLTAYDGIQFDLKGASGAQPMYFEMLTKETQPTTLGGSLAATANDTIALNNNRGYYLSGAGANVTNTSTAIPTATTTVYVPFALLIPRHFPAPSGCGTDVCQEPAFAPADALGFQFSAYPDMNNTNGSYNLTIDNVSLYTGDNGLNPASPTAASPTFNDGATGFASCKSAIPTFAGGKTAAGKYLQAAYANWKGRFVSGSPGSSRKVIRPENGNDVVSEGIGYGMLLAVYFNDEALFDDLWTYETANRTAGTLMTWNNTGGAGSATDADEDMAFALIEAGKKWGKTYAGTAATMITDIATHDIDFTANIPKGGSNYTSVNPTNPSYFAPAYYRIFAGVDAAHAWASLADHTISVIATLASSVGSHGLVPAWCGSNCTTASSNTGSQNPATDVIYQYDAHRVPWRIGVDYCWNGTAAAKSYLTTISAFFNGLYTTDGIDGIYDLYSLNGGADTGAMAEPNSMSIVGTAAVGAMAGGAAGFAAAGWQFVLDGGNRATLDVSSMPTASSYSYYNATVGLLTALTLSGNFYPM